MNLRWIVSAVAVSLCLTPPARAQEPPRALSLREAVKLALEKSPNLAAATQRLEAARAAARQTEAAFLPHLRLSETYTASDSPVQAFIMTLNQRTFTFDSNFNRPPVTDNFNTKLQASYSVYNGGRDEAARRAGRLGAETAEQTIGAVRNELVFEVTRAFYTIGKARQFEQSAASAVTSMEANVKLAKDRIDQGAALKTDLLDAEVRLAEARESLLRARNAVALAEVVFRSALGVGEEQHVTAEDVRLGGAPDNGAQTNLDISARRELIAARKTVETAEQQILIAKGANLPRVNAFAGYDIDSGNLQRFSNGWVAGVSVELKIFDGDLTRNKVAEARATHAMALEHLRGIELALQLEAKQAQLNLADAVARLETTSRSVEQAEESLQLTKDRYRNGVTLLTQVLDAETALTAARQRRAAAQADTMIARAALDKALGMLGGEQGE